MEGAPDFSPAPPAEASSSALVPVEAPEPAGPSEPEIQLAPDDQALLQDVQSRAVDRDALTSREAMHSHAGLAGYSTATRVIAARCWRP